MMDDAEADRVSRLLVEELEAGLEAELDYQNTHDPYDPDDTLLAAIDAYQRSIT